VDVKSLKTFSAFLVSFAAVSVLAAQPAAVTLEQLQRDALRASPDLQSLTRQLQAARAAAQQAGRWPNPELSISADKEEQEIALSQTFDVWGQAADRAPYRAHAGLRHCREVCDRTPRSAQRSCAPILDAGGGAAETCAARR
jgi:outer membrane protein TolC